MNKVVGISDTVKSGSMSYSKFTHSMTEVTSFRFQGPAPRFVRPEGMVRIPPSEPQNGVLVEREQLAREMGR